MKDAESFVILSPKKFKNVVVKIQDLLQKNSWVKLEVMHEIAVNLVLATVSWGYLNF